MATEIQSYRNIKAHDYRGTEAIGTLRQMTTEVQGYRNIKAHGYRDTDL